jgi:hypothetical protein
VVVGGQTPEELETLMEDAFVLGDAEALAKLFESEGMLVLGRGQEQARGHRAISKAAGLLAERAAAYLAQPRRIYENRDIALLIGEGVIHVARRKRGRSWRFVISLLDEEQAPGYSSDWNETTR